MKTRTSGLTMEREWGESDELFTFTYEVEPYDPGVWRDKDGSGYPPSGGTASIYEIRRADGTLIPQSEWPALGLAGKALERLEDDAYEEWSQHVEDAAEPPEDDDHDRGE